MFLCKRTEENICGVPPGGRYWIYLGTAPLEGAKNWEERAWGLQMLRFYFFIEIIVLWICARNGYSGLKGEQGQRGWCRKGLGGAATLLWPQEKSQCPEQVVCRKTAKIPSEQGLKALKNVRNFQPFSKLERWPSECECTITQCYLLSLLSILKIFLPVKGTQEWEMLGELLSTKARS